LESSEWRGRHARNILRRWWVSTRLLGQQAAGWDGDFEHAPSPGGTPCAARRSLPLVALATVLELRLAQEIVCFLQPKSREFPDKVKGVRIRVGPALAGPGCFRRDFPASQRLFQKSR
jgi:hypothetical protein